MPDRHEELHGIEVGRGDLTHRSVPGHERVPHSICLTPERCLRPQMNGEIVGEITESAIVKVEEHGLPDPRSVDRNTSVEAMTIAMAIRPGKVGARRDSSREAGGNRGQALT